MISVLLNAYVVPLRGRITLLQKILVKFEVGSPTPLQISELKARLLSAQDTFKEFNSFKFQSKIEVLVDEQELDNQLEHRDKFESSYFSTIALITEFIKPTKETDGSESVAHNDKSTLNIKLPDIKLPSFDGSYDHWLEFKNSYFSLIHKRTDLDFIQKFHYLKSSVSGSALQVISALEFTGSNYVHAWELLENRFHNERLLVHNHVKALFNVPSISTEPPQQLRILIDTILRNLRALKSLRGNHKDYNWDTLIIYLIVSKLDVSTERAWENHKGSIVGSSTDTKITLDELLQFLRNRADTLEMINLNHPKITISTSRNTYESKRPTTQNTLSYVTTKCKPNGVRNCLMCKGNHALYACTLCRNCLRAGHTVNECLFGPCKQCQSKHNSLLHSDSIKSDGDSNLIKPASGSSTSTALHSSTVESNASEKTLRGTQMVLLSTALVEVADDKNHFHTVRALLDNGSEHCIITESLSKRLNVSLVSQSNYLSNILMRSKSSNYNTNITCLILPNITMPVPSNHFDCDSIRISNNVSLADPTFNVPSKIELLIGADKFWDLLYDDKIRLPNAPFLQNTKLGWLVSGPLYTDSLRINNQVVCNFSQNLDTEIRKFWEIETIPKTSRVLTEDEWLHVNGQENPADLVSRGLNLNLLKDLKLWWNGPEFLSNQDYMDSNMSDFTRKIINNTDLPEINLKKVTFVASTVLDLIDFDRFSSIPKLIRSVAYVLRFINNTRLQASERRDRKTGSLSVDELDHNVWSVNSHKCSHFRIFISAYSIKCLWNSVTITKGN
ncbi:hypothetical protein ABMA28_017416 [Loxostege sticticalis]|uniref:Peptidase aspartic putative domain-containing protein n=1 Tax=Loxostege sticticalis TaxID=481309 RepID=A0ABD0S3E5_LOXSC